MRFHLVLNLFNMTQIPKWLGSSADPNTIAMTWKGVAIGLIPVIILVAKHFNFALTETDLSDFIEGTMTFISAVVVFLGLLRKVYLKYKK